MKTAERRLKLIKLLCRKRHETMTNLAAEFGVSVRTIQRDIDEISNIIPVYIKHGRYDGGVYVMDEYKMDRMYMSDDELALLKKVKNQTENIGACVLNVIDLQLLTNLISIYTKPIVK